MAIGKSPYAGARQDFVREVQLGQAGAAPKVDPPSISASIWDTWYKTIGFHQGTGRHPKVPQALITQVAQTKIWCYGPETDGANLVVDATVGVQYLIEIKAPGAAEAAGLLRCCQLLALKIWILAGEADIDIVSLVEPMG